jgi:hypothetical protein
MGYNDDLKRLIIGDIEHLDNKETAKLYKFVRGMISGQERQRCSQSELNEVLCAALDIYKPPFKYDLDGQMIFDSENNLITDVRGWGRIEKLENAVALQDAIGELIVGSLNDTWDILNKKRGA